MEDKDKVVERVVQFLYNALDNFRDTMAELNSSVDQLMDSLTKVTQDLQSIGIQAPQRSSNALRSSLISARGSGDSRSRLINLLSGKPLDTPAPATAAPTATPEITAAPKSGPPKPISGPPKTMSGPPKPISGPPKTISGPPKPMSGPPKTISGPPKPMAMAGPPKPLSAPKPMTVPKPMTGPPSSGPPVMKPPVMKPPVMKPPVMKPPVMKPPTTGPPIMKPPTSAPLSAPSAAPADQKPGGSSILGLRDEMLKELKRLKSIMKGG